MGKKAKLKKVKMAAAEAVAKSLNSLFSTDAHMGAAKRGGPFGGALSEFTPPQPSKIVTKALQTVGMDDGEDGGYAQCKPSINPTWGQIPDAQVSWFASQSFIGYQLCAILSQHWLIYKACAMPAKDAVRNGYDLTVNSGETMTPQMLAYVRKQDKKMRIKYHLQDFITKGRIFGIRIAMFKVKSLDEDYYLKPFNIDGVTPGSYEGIVQIDPYWIVPELLTQNLFRPDELHFYEPEYWRISGKIIHRSHLVIFTTGTVPDVLKPTYYYGGVSIPQRIYERVYAAERSANEAPMLLMTKRLFALFTDLEAAIGNQTKFEERMEWFRENRDNYGTRVLGQDDKVEQHDTTLSDVDAVIMTQYQLVAAVAEVPGTKLLGTQPKGFNSTGEFEESSYHETLESLQENDMTPLLDRHYMLLSRSHLMLKFGEAPEIEVDWNELDAMTSQEQAAVNATEAATDAAYVGMGAIEPADVTRRLIANPKSGYNGLKIPPPEPPAPAGGQGPAPPTGTRAAAIADAPPLPKPKITPMKGA